MKLPPLYDQRTRPSPSSSTATSSAGSAAGGTGHGRAPRATSATSATSGGTCRSTTSTRTPSSPPRRPRRPPSRARSGRCTTCCSSTRTRSARRPDRLCRAARPRRRAVREDMRKRVGGGRIAEDVDSADLCGVSGTPTFFINGRRHYGAYDIETLSPPSAPRARCRTRRHEIHAQCEMSARLLRVRLNSVPGGKLRRKTRDDRRRHIRDRVPPAPGAGGRVDVADSI